MVVSTELDQRIDDHAIDSDHARRCGPSLAAEAKASPEVVSGERERTHPGKHSRIARRLIRRSLEDGLCPHVVSGVTGLAHLLQIGVAEHGEAVRIPRVGAKRRLERPDAIVCRAARGAEAVAAGRALDPWR